MGRPNSIPEQVVAFSGLGLIISIASLSFSIPGASPSLIFYSNSHPLSLEIPEQLHVGVFNIEWKTRFVSFPCGSRVEVFSRAEITVTLLAWTQFFYRILINV